MAADAEFRCEFWFAQAFSWLILAPVMWIYEIVAVRAQ